MAVSSNRRLSSRVLAVLRKTYGRNEATTRRSGLEELLLGIIRDGASEAKAVRALNALTRHFTDWNEARVAQPHELAIAMGNVPEAFAKGRVIRDVLARLCERTNQLSLDYLRERSPRAALRLVAPMKDFPESALARALLNAHDEDVFPLTPKVVAVCQRLGIFKEDADRDAMQRAVVRAVSKQNMLEMHCLLSRHAETVCVEKEPKCAECGLSGFCPTGRKALKASQKTATRRRLARTASRRSRPVKTVGKKSPRRRKAKKERKRKTR
jgi:endonuclease III